MESLLLIGIIAALPMSIIGLVAKVTGNQILGAIVYKLPSIIILVVTIVYILKSYKII